jgi:hypothetical protein
MKSLLMPSRTQLLQIGLRLLKEKENVSINRHKKQNNTLQSL